MSDMNYWGIYEEDFNHCRECEKQNERLGAQLDQSIEREEKAQTENERLRAERDEARDEVKQLEAKIRLLTMVGDAWDTNQGE